MKAERLKKMRRFQAHAVGDSDQEEEEEKKDEDSSEEYVLIFVLTRSIL